MSIVENHQLQAQIPAPYIHIVLDLFKCKYKILYPTYKSNVLYWIPLHYACLPTSILLYLPNQNLISEFVYFKAFVTNISETQNEM